MDFEKTTSNTNFEYCEPQESRNLMLLNCLYKEFINEKDSRHTVLKRIKFISSRFLKAFKSLKRLRYAEIRIVIEKFKAAFFLRYIEDYQLQMTDPSLELKYEPVHMDRMNKKIAVYTAIYGNYDKISNPLYVNSYFDYFIFTDQKVENSCNIWKKREVEVDGFDRMDNYHKSKYCKFHPHLLLPEYEYSIWIDGNVLIVADLYPLIDRISDETVMASFQNPVHDCIYTERNFLIYHDVVRISEIDRQIEYYRSLGFPKKFGMREFSIIVRKSHDKQLISLMDEWWTQVNEYTMRDQISFPFILWKNNLSINYIEPLGNNWRDNPRFYCMPHNWRWKF